MWFSQTKLITNTNRALNVLLTNEIAEKRGRYKKRKKKRKPFLCKERGGGVRVEVRRCTTEEGKKKKQKNQDFSRRFFVSLKKKKKYLTDSVCFSTSCHSPTSVTGTPPTTFGADSSEMWRRRTLKCFYPRLDTPNHPSLVFTQPGEITKKKRRILLLEICWHFRQLRLNLFWSGPGQLPNTCDLKVWTYNSHGVGIVYCLRWR